MNAHALALLAAISIAATLACSSSTNTPPATGSGGVSGTGNAGSGGLELPVGLDLGGRTAAEIAVAVTAELISVRYERDKVAT